MSNSNAQDELVALEIDDPKNPFHTGEVLTLFEQEVISELIHRTLPQMRSDTLYSAVIVQRIPRQIFKKEYYQQLTREKRSSLVRAVIYAAAARQVCKNEDTALPTEEDMRSRFSFFSTLDLAPTSAQETVYLCRYARAIETLQSMGLRASNNKHIFMRAAAMLEGSGNRYARGGAPAKSMKRRDTIFTEITGCAARPARVAREKDFPSSDSVDVITPRSVCSTEPLSLTSSSTMSSSDEE